MPNLLYVGQNPTAGTGSPIIVLRHLRRFAADGWKIHVLADYGGDYTACLAAGWKVIHPPHRKWWWPPYREGHSILRWLRLRMLAREVVAATSPPDVVFGYLAAHADFSADLAAHVSRMTGAPLHMLVHDDGAAFPYAKGRESEIRRTHNGILKSAETCWFVSPELAECYPSTKATSRQLYPIPEGWDSPAVWRAKLSQYSPVYYAGYLWPEQYPLMKRVAQLAVAGGAELVLMTRQNDQLREFLNAEPVRWQPPFPTNREALAHLVEEAAGVLVSYADAVAEMPWCATSYPSKLVEYCHLGLPVAIVAPADSSVGRWAKRMDYPYYFAPGELAQLQEWFAGLREPEIWKEGAAVAVKFAQTEFNPERIQAELANAMIGGTEGHRA
jgi:hypothetical protein